MFVVLLSKYHLVLLIHLNCQMIFPCILEWFVFASVAHWASFCYQMTFTVKTSLLEFYSISLPGDSTLFTIQMLKFPLDIFTSKKCDQYVPQLFICSIFTHWRLYRLQITSVYKWNLWIRHHLITRQKLSALCRFCNSWQRDTRQVRND